MESHDGAEVNDGVLLALLWWIDQGQNLLKLPPLPSVAQGGVQAD